MAEALTKARSLLAETCQDPNKIPGAVLFAADRSGKTLLHEAAGVRQIGSSEPMSKDALFWMASCTKLLTAIAAIQLVEQGKLQLDSPIRQVLPEISELEKDYKTQTTLRHLLTHTAGQSYPFFNHEAEAYLAKNNLTPFGCKLASITGPLNAEPGTRWEYSTGIDWASRAVEKVSGMNLDAYFKKHIFEPLGIKNITLLPQTGIAGGVKSKLAGMNFRKKDATLEPIEHPIEMDESKQEILYGGAGAFGNAAEYCQVLVALMNEGTHPVTKGKILSPESVKDLMKDQLADEQLIKDLERPIPAAQPEFTNPLVMLEGVPKNWAFAGCKTPKGMPTGRSSQGVWWAGIANNYWFLDNENGVCGMIQTQILPFFDPYVVPLFFMQIEPELHQAVKSQ
ncbi:beta-lactamase/transpeptidase-like protein [Dendrothele bispora CBS 962.96]|uniref:Beta-lactamase/transpeptidase-like protein n=1 Tax=Dendrothele bispora (strain CBS 962.96) TaxID=1314807 RepID=A0A4S8LRW3_DENBC|nr:beta-lactamase/transpeptidase-like protein [Dendrothele bispora CBS 962.96]